ncbi:AAA family ATPase [Corallococcus sp. H22C18031201]|nr:AAA family ATPase [Corallococcus sp. H22C18031201]
MSTYPQAAQAFRRFFGELRETFLEREAFLTQIELALLCREHVLVVGPPGTAKSAIASAVLGRITDEGSGLPSLFSKQIAESTVQADLIGPVDFKVLTETGRTEYLTEEGMLGSVHAFLDEVFDGRDMLLRSILNVLYERELKHGRRVTVGRTECVIMTSNRYLSEVLAQSPELLLAFADRMSFICFVPKAFARRESRAAMLQRFVGGVRPDLKAALTLQQLDLLQAQVERVTVPGHVLEGVELLADALERVLVAQVSKLPDYVPTKYFSQRSIVKAMWALKAAVVRDQIYRRPDRPLEATVEDLDALRWFFLLGGPQSAETEALLKASVDPRERAQLEIVRLEQRAFDDALAQVRQELGGGLEREAAALAATEDVASVESLGRAWQPATVSITAKGLLGKLVPGPRHAQNRAPLLGAARSLVAVTEQRLARGMSAPGEGRMGMPLLAAVRDVLALCRAVPELQPVFPSLCTLTARFLAQAFELWSLAAEGLAFEDGFKVDSVVGLASNLEEEFGMTSELAAILAEGLPAAQAQLREADGVARKRVVMALRRRVVVAFQGQPPRTRKDPLDALTADSRRLTQVDQSLQSLDASQPGLKQELLRPLGVAYAREVLGSTPFDRLQQYARALQSVTENLRREGVAPEALIADCREIIETRIREHAGAVARQSANIPPAPVSALNGDAYSHYREEVSARALDGEFSSLVGLEGLLAPAGGVFSEGVREAVARAELAFLESRVTYLRVWLSQLLSVLPPPESLTERTDAERTFDRLVRSRFPLLALKEGELVRLQAALAVLRGLSGEVGGRASELVAMLKRMDEDFGQFSRHVLDRRTAA